MSGRKKTTLQRVAVDDAIAEVASIIEVARHAAARSVNAIMTATYWEVGHRIVEQEQQGSRRAGYGDELLVGLSAGLTARFGRGFSERNLRLMRAFYLSPPEIWQTPSAGSDVTVGLTIRQTASAESVTSHLARLATRFPLPWSHYVRLLSVEDLDARLFYEAEGLRGGWTVRQLDRQIETQFYERTMLSRSKSAMLRKGARRRLGDEVVVEEELKDPLVLEFLDLKDEYSESDLERALVQGIESFLLEMGGDFTFVGRRRRLRIGDEWYRIDLLFFHRRLRCLVIIDLKLGKFSPAAAGQMHLYLNYAREHWMVPGENPPVGLIRCASKNEAVVKYALDGLSNKVLAATYRTTLPTPGVLASQLTKTREALDARRAMRPNARKG